MKRPLLAAVIAGLLVGGAVTAVLVVGWSDKADTVTGTAAARQFVTEWERSRRGTYHSEGTFERRMTSGSTLRSHVETVQRPPDYLRVEFNGVDGVINGRRVICSNDPKGIAQCRQSGTRVDFEKELAGEMKNWTNYFIGSVPLYIVSTTGDGCFDLKLSRAYLLPPYGYHTRFCFDDATGAITYTKVENSTYTEVTKATRVTPQVTAADFRLPG